MPKLSHTRELRGVASSEQASEEKMRHHGMGETPNCPDFNFQFSDSGRIYHQAIVDESTCNNPAYVNRIGLNIARQFKDPNARITCCSTDGCNWRWDTAVSNQAIGQSLTAASSNTVYYGYIGRLAHN